jgi:hypothetical protein
LAEPLSAEDCCAQSMPDASPVKWHLAHTTWFFETFVLEPNEAGFRPFHPAFRVLFNSYYNGVGARHPRPQRGLLTRPALSRCSLTVPTWTSACRLCWRGKADNAALQTLVELGLQHEQQHQELLLTDVLHLLSCNPLAPAYRDAPPAAGSRRRHWAGWNALAAWWTSATLAPVFALTTNCRATPPTWRPTLWASGW